MRSFRPLLPVLALSLAASCALLSRAYRSPRAPPPEAAKVKFPWGTPRETVVLTGVWLRAVGMALDDYLPEEEAERAKAEGEEEACLSRRDNYHIEAFVWSPRSGSDGGAGAADGGAPLDDGGPAPGSDADAGHPSDAGASDAFSQPGMPKAPPVIYVAINLIADCNPGGSPLLDVGAVYAIDTVNWRILAIRH